MMKFTKTTFLFTALLLSKTLFAQTTFYPNAAGANQLDSLSSWGTNPDGTGTTPTSFTAANQIFNVSNSTGITSFNTGGSWTVTGTATKLFIPSGNTLTVDSGYTLSLATTANDSAGLKVDGVLTGKGILTISGNVSATREQDWFVLSGGSVSQPGVISIASAKITSNYYAKVAAGSYLNVQTTFKVGVIGQVKNYGTLQLDNYTSSGADFKNETTGNMTVMGTLNVQGTFTNSGWITVNNGVVIQSFGDKVANYGAFYVKGAAGIIAQQSTLDWDNNANSYLEVEGPLFPTNGTLSASAAGNTVKYAGVTTFQDIKKGTYYNLIVAKSNAPSQGQVASLTGAVTATNFTIESGIVDVSIADYSMTIKGNWVNNNLFIPRNGRVTFSGSAVQYITNNGGEEFYNVTVNKTGGSLILNDNAKVANLQLTDGIVVTDDTSLFIVQATGTATGATDSSYVDGPVSKIGSTDFIFPVGKDSKYRPIGVNNLSGSETFTAEYIHSDPNTAYSTSQKDASLISLSNCEYWNLTRAGATTANVILSLDSVNNCGFTDPTTLVVAGWDGTIWKDYQRNGLLTSGPIGMLTSNVQPSTYTAFTLGTSTFDKISDQETSITALSLFPNPANESVQLNYFSKSGAAYALEIADMAGKIVVSQHGISSYGMNKLTLGVSDLQSGLYIVTLNSGKDSQRMRLTIE